MRARIADYFGVPAAPYPGHEEPLAKRLKGVGSEWSKIVKKHGLRNRPIEKVAPWWHVDIDYAGPSSASPTWETAGSWDSSTTKTAGVPSWLSSSVCARKKESFPRPQGKCPRGVPETRAMRLARNQAPTDGTWVSRVAQSALSISPELLASMYRNTVSMTMLRRRVRTSRVGDVAVEYLEKVKRLEALKKLRALIVHANVDLVEAGAETPPA